MNDPTTFNMFLDKGQGDFQIKLHENCGTLNIRTKGETISHMLDQEAISALISFLSNMPAYQDKIKRMLLKAP